MYTSVQGKRCEGTLERCLGVFSIYCFVEGSVPLPLPLPFPIFLPFSLARALALALAPVLVRALALPPSALLP
eukprot:3648529-Heterocapsa_arctica.AAC.1